MKLFLTLSVLVLLFGFGCNDDPIQSEIPEISFGSASVYKNMAGKDSMVILTINYKDGDGDLGLAADDTLPPFNFGNQGFYNLFVGYKIKKNGIWQSILIPGSADTLHFNQRFQRLNLGDKEKAVTGSLDLRIPASPYPGILPDTIKLISQMMDRKLHKSNVSESTEIFLKH
ncbi:MAG: hypothetical protein ACKVQB_09925 [Bacteroidia bacterium]